MTQPFISGNQVWCETCKDYVQMLRVPKAASLADVSRRTVYRYIGKGSVFALKIAGGAYRVCGRCLLRQHSRADREDDERVK
ncbi:MAG TPA: helix-turn-helix domain-containing protein [Pyrinomonadaceae bacterium]|jgi:hypothetical protein